MTEETKSVEPKVAKYVRPKYVVGLWKMGINKMEDLIAAVRAHEATVVLRKNVKHERNDYFYKRNIHWALSDATKAGEIEGYAIKTRKTKAKTEVQLPGQQSIETAVTEATQEAPVNNVEASSEIPTI